MQIATNKMRAVKANESLLICPDCKANIPFITFQFNTAEIFIEVKCPCFKPHFSHENRFLPLEYYIELCKKNSPVTNCVKHNLFQGRVYCHQCSTWLCNGCGGEHSNEGHSTCMFSLRNVKCYQHNQPFSNYCLPCQSNQCSHCNCRHSSSQKLKLSDVDTELLLSNLNKAKEILTSEKEKYKQILSFKEATEQIISFMNTFQSLNELMIKFYQLLYKTAISMKGLPTFQLMELASSLILSPFRIDVQGFKNNKFEGVADGTWSYPWMAHFGDEDVWTVKSRKEKLSDHINCEFVLRTLRPKPISRSSEESNISCLLALQDGHFASSEKKGPITIWDSSSMTVIATLKGKASLLIQLRDGRLVGTPFDRTISVWNIQSKSSVTYLKQHKPVIALLELNDGRLASLSEDYTVRIWNVTTFVSVCTVVPYEFVKRGALVNYSDDSFIVYSNSIGVINASTLTLKQVQLKEKIIADCLIQIDKKQFVFVTGRSIMSLNMNTCEIEIIGEAEKVLLLSKLTSILFAVSSSNCIKIWSITSMSWVFDLETKHDGRSLCLVNSKLLFVNSGVIYQYPLTSLLLLNISN